MLNPAEVSQWIVKKRLKPLRRKECTSNILSNLTGSKEWVQIVRKNYSDQTYGLDKLHGASEHQLMIVREKYWTRLIF